MRILPKHSISHMTLCPCVPATLRALQKYHHISCRYRQKVVSLQHDLALKLADKIEDEVYIS